MATDEKAEKAKHRITLTRAALYILEGSLQNPGPCTTPAKIVQWAKVWNKIRSANNRTVRPSWAPQGVDFEKSPIRNEGETDLAFVQRNIEWNDLMRKWEDEQVVLTMNDKIRDVCREAVEWIHAHREDAKVAIKLSGKHAASLLVNLGICKPEDDDDYEMSIDDEVTATEPNTQPA